jgi:hypothetical protein
VTLDIRAVGFACVKGTRHRTLSSATFDSVGPVGDRRYCLVDVVCRRVLKTVEHPSLVAVTAHEHGNRLEISTPDGEVVRAAAVRSGERLRCDYWGRPVDLELIDGPHAAVISAWLGRDVRLAAAPRGAIVYGDPISVITTASLTELAGVTGHAELLGEASRFRATLLVATNVPYAEDGWSGRELDAGALRLRFGPPIPRCAVIDIDPIDGTRNGRLLAALATRACRDRGGVPTFGVYARVVEPDDHALVALGPSAAR